MPAASQIPSTLPTSMRLNRHFSTERSLTGLSPPAFYPAYSFLQPLWAQDLWSCSFTNLSCVVFVCGAPSIPEGKHITFITTGRSEVRYRPSTLALAEFQCLILHFTALQLTFFGLEHCFKKWESESYMPQTYLESQCMRLTWSIVLKIFDFLM